MKSMKFSFFSILALTFVSFVLGSHNVNAEGLDANTPFMLDPGATFLDENEEHQEEVETYTRDMTEEERLLLEAESNKNSISSRSKTVTKHSMSYVTQYKVLSRTSTKHYGSWRNGPSGKGPATLAAHNSNTTNRSFTASLSGTIPGPLKSSVQASTGVTFGKSQTYGVSYSVNVEKKKRKQITFRPYYQKFKVVTEEKKLWYGGRVDVTKRTAHVSKFLNWDYSWKYLK